MRRRDFLRQLAWGALALGTGGTGASGLGCSPGRRANLILIVVDDLGWTDLGCYGSREHETPNIDRMCSEGIRFTDAYAASAVCSPSRAALLTGRSPARIGVTDFMRHPKIKEEGIPSPDGGPGLYVDDRARRLLYPVRVNRLPPREVTLAEVLRPAGYATAHVGKWHLGDGGSLPRYQGFDVNKGGGWYSQAPTYWDPYAKGRIQGLPGLPSRERGEYLTDREAAEAVAFIRDNRERPFLLNLWHYAVHYPLEAKEELVRKYGERIRGPHAKQRAQYAAMLESVDQAVGSVLAALDELGIAERTLVLLTSDNGGQAKLARLAPLRGGKGGPYEGGIRVPWIVRWKQRVAPGECSAPVSSADVFPTFCAAAHAPMPEDVVIDGRSLMPILDGDPGGVSGPLFWHYPHYWQREMPYSIVRRGSWKLIQRYDGAPRFELYDLSRDPGEKKNLAGERIELREELRQELQLWLAASGALLPKRRGPPRPT